MKALAQMVRWLLARCLPRGGSEDEADTAPLGAEADVRHVVQGLK